MRNENNNYYLLIFSTFIAFIAVVYSLTIMQSGIQAGLTTDIPSSTQNGTIPKLAVIYEQYSEVGKNVTIGIKNVGCDVRVNRISLNGSWEDFNLEWWLTGENNYYTFDIDIARLPKWSNGTAYVNWISDIRYGGNDGNANSWTLGLNINIEK